MYVPPDLEGGRWHTCRSTPQKERRKRLTELLAGAWIQRSFNARGGEFSAILGRCEREEKERRELLQLKKSKGEA